MAPPSVTTTTPKPADQPKARPKKRAKRGTPVLKLPRPTLQKLNFLHSVFTDMEVQLIDGKAVAKVSDSPYDSPDEALLFLEEDMVPNIDMGALPRDRVDNLYGETNCPYWDPRIKGHMISRLDVKTHQPTSRAGRFMLTNEERKEREKLKLQVKNRKRRLQVNPCRDPELNKWQQWKKAAKAKEQMVAPSQQSANIPSPQPTPPSSPANPTPPTSPTKEPDPIPVAEPQVATEQGAELVGPSDSPITSSPPEEDEFFDVGQY